MNRIVLLIGALALVGGGEVGTKTKIEVSRIRPLSIPCAVGENENSIASATGYIRTTTEQVTQLKDGLPVQIVEIERTECEYAHVWIHKRGSLMVDEKHRIWAPCEVKK